MTLDEALTHLRDALDLSEGRGKLLIVRREELAMIVDTMLAERTAIVKEPNA